MFVLFYNGMIFGDELAKPNTLDDIAKPQHKQILVLARAKTIQERLHSVQKHSKFEIPALFPRRTGDEKKRQFQNWNYIRLNGVVLILSYL